MGARKEVVAELVAAAALLAVGTVVTTWPLLRHPATRVLDSPSLYGAASVLVQRDINLTLWVLAWDVHALATDPLGLFHANALYPAPYSLALSEHMLGNVPLFAPVYLATGNPVLAHQTALVATFVLAGLAMAVWLRWWTGDRLAALAGGLLFAFAPYRLWQIGNLHVISIHWLPLVLLGVDLACAGRRRAGAALLAAALALSAGCSYYVGYAAFALAGVYAAVRAVTGGRAARAGLGAVAAGLVLAAAAVAAVTVPYLILQARGVLPGGAREPDFGGLAFLATAFGGPARLASRLVVADRDGIPQFLGLGVLALAAAGVALHRRPPRGALVASAVTGFVLALGPFLFVAGERVALPYRWLMAVVPGFAAMRVPQRFGALVMLAATALAGLGLAAVRARLAARGAPRAAVLLPALAVVTALVEWRLPPVRTIEQAVGTAMPPVHRWLAAHGDGGAVIELPADGTKPFQESQAMYHSTAHWLPLANGYSPYPPPTYRAFMAAAGRLPDPGALDALLAVAPLRWLVVHRTRIPDAEWPRWTAAFAAAGLRTAVEAGDAHVFEVPAARRAPQAAPAS